jgi:type I restriction-modification system DNA methylase subunit
MAIILPHGVLFRGGAEARIRTKLLKDGHIDTVFHLIQHDENIVLPLPCIGKYSQFYQYVCRPNHGVLFRGGAEAIIRTKLLKDGHIDTVIGLPAKLFFSTGIPVCENRAIKKQNQPHFLGLSSDNLQSENL